MKENEFFFQSSIDLDFTIEIVTFSFCPFSLPALPLLPLAAASGCA